MSEEQLLKLALNGFVLDPKAWKENANSDRPRSAMGLVCELVPAKFLLNPTPIVAPKQKEQPTTTRSFESFTPDDAVGISQVMMTWKVHDSSDDFNMVFSEPKTQISPGFSKMDELQLW